MFFFCYLLLVKYDSYDTVAQFQSIFYCDHVTNRFLRIKLSSEFQLALFHSQRLNYKQNRQSKVSHCVYTCDRGSIIMQNIAAIFMFVSFGFFMCFFWCCFFLLKIQVIDLNIETFVIEMPVSLWLSMRLSRFYFICEMNLQMIFLCCFMKLVLGTSTLDLDCRFNFAYFSLILIQKMRISSFLFSTFFSE